MPFLKPANLFTPLAISALLCSAAVYAQPRSTTSTPVPEFSANPNLHRQTNIQLKEKAPRTAVATPKAETNEPSAPEFVQQHKTVEGQQLATPTLDMGKPADGGVFFVQVAALQDADNAVALLQRVAATKLRPVQLEQADHDGVMTYKVRIGPLVDRVSVKNAQIRLKAAKLPVGFVVESQQRDFSAP